MGSNLRPNVNSSAKKGLDCDNIGELAGCRRRNPIGRLKPIRVANRYCHYSCTTADTRYSPSALSMISTSSCTAAADASSADCSDSLSRISIISSTPALPNLTGTPT